jgi:hypothetical protein
MPDRFADDRGREYGHGGPNIVLAHTAFGEPLTKTGPVNSPAPSQSGVDRAGLFSSAPYKPTVVSDACIGNAGTDKPPCKGSRMKGSKYCVGHARSLGLVPSGGNQWTKMAEEESTE